MLFINMTSMKIMIWVGKNINIFDLNDVIFNISDPRPLPPAAFEITKHSAPPKGFSKNL